MSNYYKIASPLFFLGLFDNNLDHSSCTLSLTSYPSVLLETTLAYGPFPLGDLEGGKNIGGREIGGGGGGRGTQSNPDLFPSNKYVCTTDCMISFFKR